MAHAENSHVSTHVPGFQSSFLFLHHFVLEKLACISIRVKFDKCFNFRLLHIRPKRQDSVYNALGITVLNKSV